MTIVDAVRSGVNAACGALRVARSAGAHAAWWLDHHLGGTPRHAAAEQAVRGRGDAVR